MRANIVIDDELMQAALKAGGLPSKKAAVEAGLRLLIRVRAKSGVRRLRDKIKWDGDLDEMRAGRLYNTDQPSAPIDILASRFYTWRIGLRM